MESLECRRRRLGRCGRKQRAVGAEGGMALLGRLACSLPCPRDRSPCRSSGVKYTCTRSYVHVCLLMCTRVHRLRIRHRSPLPSPPHPHPYPHYSSYINPSIYIIHPPNHISIYPSICPSIYLFIYIHPSIHPPSCLRLPVPQLTLVENPGKFESQGKSGKKSRLKSRKKFGDKPGGEPGDIS